MGPTLLDAAVVVPAAMLGLLGLWLGFARSSVAWPMRWLLALLGAYAAGRLRGDRPPHPLGSGGAVALGGAARRLGGLRRRICGGARPVADVHGQPDGPGCGLDRSAPHCARRACAWRIFRDSVLPGSGGGRHRAYADTTRDARRACLGPRVGLAALFQERIRGDRERTVTRVAFFGRHAAAATIAIG